MKYILTILFVFVVFTTNAQNRTFTTYNTADNSQSIVIPTVILASTAISVSVLYNYESDITTIDCVALTGIATSLMSYIIINKVKDNTPRKLRHKRRKKLSRL